MGNLNHEPVLCASGCGFYGNPGTQSLCSLCFRNMQTVLEQPQLQSLANNDDTNKGPEAVASHENSNNSDCLKKKNRCVACKKRVGLLGFECRCGGLFCGSHRSPPEMHMCMFDHKEAGRVGLSKKLFDAAECKANKLQHRI